MLETTKTLSLQDNESMKNSFYRAPKKAPSIKKLSESKIEVRTSDDSCYIEKLEETILHLIAQFKFSPVWLIQQWFYRYYKNDGYEHINNWIKTGLVWVETTSMGVFLRPTKFLFDMFKVDNEKYLEIPFGLLNHTCAEQQIMFDIQMGNDESELWLLIKNENTLPVYHPLELTIENEQGTLCIRESDFRLGFKRYSVDKLLQFENEIKSQISSGVKFSDEFNDFAKFPIVNVDENGELTTQTPDVIIPIPRDNGKAKSYAIEIELSPKQPIKYKDILNNYKDNIKFGKLFYLCGSQRISKLVRDAFKDVGGLGTCELYIVPFLSPAQRLENYNANSIAESTNFVKQSEEANE